MNLHDSVSKLKSIGLNIGEPVMDIRATDDPMARAPLERVFAVVMDAFRRKGYKGVVRTESRVENFTPLNPEELEMYMTENGFKEDFVLFKFPKNNEMLVHGYCTPNFYYNVYQFSNMSGTFRVAWGSNVDERGFLNNSPGYKAIVDRVNSILRPKVQDLENCEVEFSLFERGAGLNNDRLVFWGYRINGKEKV